MVDSVNNLNISKTFSITSAAELMEQNAASQGLNVALRKHQHFDWEQLGIAGVTAGIMGGTAGKNLEKTLRKIDFNTGILSSELNSLANAGVQQAATGATFNATQVLSDNLGSAIGSGIIRANSPWENPDEQESFNILDESNLSDAVLDVIHPERTTDAVYNNYVAQMLNESDGYGDLLFKSDLLKNENKDTVSFEDKVYWGSKQHGVQEFINAENFRNNLGVNVFSSINNVRKALNATYGTNINFLALSKFEGGQIDHGYLPMNNQKNVLGQSGITFATGFDVGQCSPRDIKKYLFSDTIEKKLLPFAGAKKDEAKILLPLGAKTILSKEELNEIDFKVKGYHLKSVIKSWNIRRLEGTPKFEELSSAQQTVLLARTFHQGLDMPETSVAQKFYKSALKNNWKEAERYLRNYNVKDKYYINRVNDEANLLKQERLFK
jgi:hypothetical protein